MLGGVGQRFRDDVIGGHLNGLGQPSLNTHTELDRDRSATPKGSQSRPQPSVGQHRRMNAVRNLSYFLACVSKSVTDIAQLTMRDFSDEFLEHYLDKAGDNATNSVGAYQLEGVGAQLFDKIEGDYFTILGLPLFALLGFLRKEGCLAG